MPSSNLVRLACEDTHNSSSKMRKTYNEKISEQQMKLFIHAYKQLESKTLFFPITVDSGFCCKIGYCTKQIAV